MAHRRAFAGLAVALLGPLTLAAAQGSQGVEGSAPSSENAMARLHESAPKFRTWSVADGLSQSSITSIAQSQDGYLWLSTFGGLVRFDGARFQRWPTSNDDGGSVRLVATCLDADGSLWIGSQNAGVGCLRSRELGEDAMWYGPDRGAPSGDVRSLGIDAAGTLWACGSELRRFVDGQWKRPELEGFVEDSAEVFQCVFADGDVLWVGSSHGLWRIEGGRAARLVARDEGGPARVSALHRNADGLWVATSFGLARLSASGDRLVPVPGFPRVEVTALATAPTGALHVGTSIGLFRAGAGDSGDSEASRFEQILPDACRYVRALFYDREDSLWIGTNGQGLIQVPEVRFTRLSEYGSSPNVASLLASDGGDGLWMLKGGRIQLYSRGHLFEIAELKVASQESSVTDLSNAPDGTLYCLTRKALHRYGGSNLELVPLDSEGSFSTVLAGRDGTVWVSDEEGLLLIEEGLSRRLPTPLGRVAGHQYTLLVEEPDGSVWFSFGTGHRARLMRVAPDARVLEAFSRGDGLPGYALRAARLDSDGGLWGSTYGGGLVHVKDGALRVFTTRDGLPDDSLGAIFEDDNENLWINSNLGVFRVPRSELEELGAGQPTPLSCRIFLTGEGNGPSGVRSPDGRLWFPTVEGVAIIDPENVGEHRGSPLLALEEVVANGVRRSSAHELDVAPGRGDLEVHYTALSFRNPEQIRFRYRLSGFDPDWNDAGTRRVAYYTNVPPGDYRFELAARSSDGIWSEVPVALDVRFEPFFYQTDMFRIAILGLAFLGLWGSYLIRTQVIRRHNQALQVEVAERRRTEADLRLKEELLRRSEDRYRALVDNCPDGLMIVQGERGVILDASTQAERILGAPREALLKQSIVDLASQHKDGAGLHVENGIALALAGGTPSLAWKKIGPEGEEIIYEGRMVQLKSGDPETMVVSVGNITERRELERRLQQATKMEALGRLAGGVSHDLNNILTAMLGEVEIFELARGLSDVGSSDEADTFTRELRACIDRATSLTSQLLAFSRQQVRRPEVVDPSVILEGMGAMLQRLLPQDVELCLELDPGADLVRVDTNQLEQVVMNLTLNARDAMPAGGRVTISTGAIELEEEDGGGPVRSFVRISVSDTGTGIDPEAIPNLFEPFFTTKDPGRGTGLGLASVEGIVRQSGGRIHVRTELGSGSTFHVDLPRVEAVAAGPPPERDELHPFASESAAPPAGPHRILVCDDDPDVRRVVERILRSKEYVVLTAGHPDEALRLAEQAPGAVDLLLSDVVMPGMHGGALAEAMLAVQPELRVLFLSGYVSKQFDLHGIAENDLLVKPFSAEALLDRVDEALRGPLFRIPDSGSQNRIRP